MGNCLSISEHKGALKKSILSNFVPDNEWDYFASLWRSEKPQLVKNIFLHEDDAMYVVVSGKVEATMYRLNHDASPENIEKVQTFEAGDLIHMFSNNTRGLHVLTIVLKLIISSMYIIFNCRKRWHIVVSRFSCDV